MYILFFLSTPQPPIWATKLGDEDDEEDDGDDGGEYNNTCVMITKVNFDGAVCVSQSFLHVPVDVYKKSRRLCDVMLCCGDGVLSCNCCGDMV